jgi:heterodisulfide reductase subunit A
MANANILIDGQPIEVPEGSFVLEAARTLGIDIPTLCYYAHMTPYAACRMCVVEARDGRGWSKIVTSCNYPAWEGLQILTHTPRVINARRVNLEMLQSRCAKLPVLDELAAKLGVKQPRWGYGTDTCILCGLCVRICDEVVGAHALAFSDRGISRRVASPFGEESPDCILCGACARYCPTGHISMEDIEGRVLPHREMSLGPNSAITIPFRQAVPNVPHVDAENCIHFRTGGCQICTKVCPKGAIDLKARHDFEEIDVGAIVLATGFDSFDPSVMKQYGYGRLPNVVTAEEFEIMNNAAGPTGGKVLLEDGTEPQAIAIVHCVGSRDENHHKYCSRVCCMYAFKFAHLVREKTTADVYDFYIDVRSFGKGYEEFYQRILDEDVNVIRGKVAEVVPSTHRRRPEGRLLVRCEDTLIGKFREIPVDMVILCTALEARADAADVARTFGVSVGADGWFHESHPKLGPVTTTTDGVMLAGACQGAKDIPDSVAQGGAAASHVMKLFCKGEIEMESGYAQVQEDYCSGCRICNDLCPYHAIDFIADDKVSRVNSALCKGCGTCAAACPAGAIRALHFTDEQIYAQIEAVLA